MTVRDDIRKMVRQTLQVQPMTVMDRSDDPGKVILDDGSGAPLEVPCLASYSNRQPGQQVSVLKITAVGAASWLVLGANGTDPATDLDKDVIQEMIDASIDALDIPPEVDVTASNSPPSGSGWQQAAVLPFYKDLGDGDRAIHFQLATASSSPSTKPPAQPRVVTITPNSHGSWRSNRQTSGDILQGNSSAWGGLSAWWLGAIFYGTKINDACNGRVPSKAELTISRAKGEGWNDRIPIHLGYHGTSSKGRLSDLNDVHVGAQLAWGGSATIQLSADWRQKMPTGALKGFGIQYTGSHDYLALTGGSGTLKLTFG